MNKQDDGNLGRDQNYNDIIIMIDLMSYLSDILCTCLYDEPDLDSKFKKKCKWGSKYDIHQEHNKYLHQNMDVVSGFFSNSYGGHRRHTTDNG